MCPQVETEAPVNLTFQLLDAGGDETGHNALLSWSYPKPADLQYGWITLVYELQYRRASEVDNWKVGSADGRAGRAPQHGISRRVSSGSTGEAVSAGASHGAAQPPRGRLCGPGPLPVQELPTVEQVERPHADENPRWAVCRCVAMATATATNLVLASHCVLMPRWPCAGKLLVQVLVAGFGIGAALVVTFVIISQSKR